jgi:hypothetical protein
MKSDVLSADVGVAEATECEILGNRINSTATSEGITHRSIRIEGFAITEKNTLSATAFAVKFELERNVMMLHSNIAGFGAIHVYNTHLCA